MKKLIFVALLVMSELSLASGTVVMAVEGIGKDGERVGAMGAGKDPAEATSNAERTMKVEAAINHGGLKEYTSSRIVSDSRP